MHRVLTFVSVVAASCALVACASRATPVGAAPLDSVLASPAVAASLVGVASETALPLPTPSPGSEGTLPPMEPGGRTLDTNDPDSVWMAQNVIDVFAQEVEAVAQNSPDYCNVAVDGFHDGMTVWWRGTPSPTVLGVLDRARRAGITPVVLTSAIDRRTLDAAVDRLSNRMQDLGMTELSRSSDCSGLDVGLLVATQQAEADVTAAVGRGIPLHFSETGPMSAA
jgi:hypothetical protein